MTLSRPMCASVVDELEFLIDRLNDPLVHEVAQAVTDFMTIRLRRPSWEGPSLSKATERTCAHAARRVASGGGKSRLEPRGRNVRGSARVGLYDVEAIGPRH